MNNQSIRNLWEGFIDIAGAGWVCPCSVKDLVVEWSCFPISKKVRKVWMAAPLYLIWEIWKERNCVVFEDMPFSYCRLKNSFVSIISSGASLLDVGDDTFVRILLCIL